MREIKFRVWDEDKMINLGDAYDRDLISFSRVVDNYMRSEFEGVKLLEFTGLKDKNGKDVYEGDIIRFDDDEPFFAEVVWYRYGWAMKYQVGESVFGKEYQYLNEIEFENLEDDNKFEVIGNIFENPDLIN